MTAKSFNELVPIAKTLNDESSDLNTTIAQINQKLAGLNLGIEVWCDPCGDGHLQIGFAKIDDGKASAWELVNRSCVPVTKIGVQGEEYWEAEPGSLGFAQPLIRASRSIRVEGLACVPEIIRALKAEAQEQIETIQNAKKIAAEWTVTA